MIDMNKRMMECFENGDLTTPVVGLIISKLSLKVSIRSIGLICAALSFLSLPALAQQTEGPPVIVQPGAPGQPSRTLPASTRPKIPSVSGKDVEFMQGMIMHHAQAIEMTALIDSRTTNAELRLLGARISHSQAEEINFMRRWLTARGRSVEMPKVAGMDMANMNMPGMGQPSAMMLMPGMLTPKQMEALKNAKGKEFDRLFLEGMIQHHGGALTMVKDLFDSPGAGQDSEIFGFATDVDTGQRAEIRIMQKMLDEKP